MNKRELATRSLAALGENKTPGLNTVLPMLANNPRYARLVEVALLARAGWSAYQSLRERFDQPEGTWEVSVSSADQAYPAALALLERGEGGASWTSVTATLERIGGGLFDDFDDTSKSVIQVEPDRADRRVLQLGEHTVGAAISIPETPPGSKWKAEATAVFSAATEAGRDAVLHALQAEADRLHAERTTRTPNLRVWGMGGFRRRGMFPFRPVESVVTADNLVQSIVDDLRTFRGREDEYIRRAVPYHRGYLLHGPPGTGKTSAVKAVAHALSMDLYYSSLGTIGSDTSLDDLVADVPPNAILLLEDIDSFAASRARSEDHADTGGKGLSVTGLLNVLDGVNTPHGQVVFMTTNHREFIDPALLRPGRVDRHFHFDNPDDATVERHFEYFYGRPPSMPLAAAGRSGADVNEVLVRNMDNPEGAEAALARRIMEVAA